MYVCSNNDIFIPDSRGDYVILTVSFCLFVCLYRIAPKVVDGSNFLDFWDQTI